MGYVLSSGGTWNDAATAARRADTALAVPRAFTDYLGQDHRHSIRVDAGQPASLALLLAVANRQASDPSNQGGQGGRHRALLRPREGVSPTVSAAPTQH